MECPKCGSSHVIRYGTKGDRQQWRCKNCNRQFMYGGPRRVVPRKIVFNLSLGYVIGVLVGDGSLTITRDYHYFKGPHKQVRKAEATQIVPRVRHNIQLGARDKDFVDMFANHLEKITGNPPTVYPVTRSISKHKKLPGFKPNYVYKGYNLRLTSKEWYFKLKPLREDLGWIENSTPDVKIGFLKGFFDSEGCFYLGKHWRGNCLEASITIYNKDLDLLWLTVKFLEELGIYSKINRGRDVPRVEIHRNKAIEKFAELIGFTIERKLEKFRKWRSQPRLRSISRFSA